MGESSDIEWTDGTWNPWEGCQKVGPGCDNCYAEARNQRFSAGANWGPGAPRRRTSEHNWNNPARWNRQHEKFFAEHGRRRRIFCASLADIFDNKVPHIWTFDALLRIAAATNIDWILLTKRINNMTKRVPETWLDEDQPNGWPQHVGLMITVVNQAEADRDISKLRDLKHAYGIPWVGLSIEPMLGPMDISRHPGGRKRVDGKGFVYGEKPFHLSEGRTNVRPRPKVDWVIVGGESGNNARPMHPDWARAIRDQCAAAGVPFFFKQWGEWLPLDEAEERIPRKPGDTSGQRFDLYHVPEGPIMARVGKARAGRLLDGVEHSAFPAAFRSPPKASDNHAL